MAANQGSSASAPRVLMLSNTDRGEVNIFLATCASLYKANPDIEIHLATAADAKLDKDIAAVWERAQRDVPGVKNPITRHVIDGISMRDGMVQLWNRKKTKLLDGVLPASFAQPLGFSVTKQAIKDMMPILTPFTGPEMVTMVNSIESIIKKVNADIVMVDSLMTAGITAVWHLDVNWAVLSPNSIKEFAVPLQKGAPGLWKYPTVFSGYSFPVPWYRIPFNIFFAIYSGKRYLSDKDRKEGAAYLKKETGADLKTPVDFIVKIPDNLRVYVGTSLDLDYPLGPVPGHIHPCGPIIGSVDPLSQSDPELEQWLAKSQTIYVNLGSLYEWDEQQTVEFARALRIVLDKCKTSLPQLQVLWKVKPAAHWKLEDKSSELFTILKDEIANDTVRIVKWVTADPMAVLQSKQVVCCIHHGGANSYNEACIAGVPQVVLPKWTDTYDYAERVKYHGIGCLGSTTRKPLWEAVELSTAITHVIDSPATGDIQKKVATLAATCNSQPSGADVAAQKILEECQQAKDKPSAKGDDALSSENDEKTT